MTKPDDEMFVKFTGEGLKKLRELSAVKNVSKESALGRIVAAATGAAMQETPVPGITETPTGPPRTLEWASLVLPMAWAIVAIAAITFLVPIAVITGTDGMDPATKIDKLANWGTHVLPVVVGFASAVLAYYFGTSASTNGKST